MKTIIEIYLNANTVAALFGWLAFNFILFRMEKDTYDSANKAFPLGAYVQKTWDNWIASLVIIPALLYVGYNKLDFGIIGEHPIAWSDLYYLGSGIITELLIKAISKWRNQ